MSICNALDPHGARIARGGGETGATFVDGGIMGPRRIDQIYLRDRTRRRYYLLATVRPDHAYSPTGPIGAVLGG